jgi:hypothetical protein
LTDKSIRNEADVEAALELPILVTVPWVNVTHSNGSNGTNGGMRFWHRGQSAKEQKTGVVV